VGHGLAMTVGGGGNRFGLGLVVLEGSAPLSEVGSFENGRAGQANLVQTAAANVIRKPVRMSWRARLAIEGRHFGKGPQLGRRGAGERAGSSRAGHPGPAGQRDATPPSRHGSRPSPARGFTGGVPGELLVKERARRSPERYRLIGAAKKENRFSTSPTWKVYGTTRPAKKTVDALLARRRRSPRLGHPVVAMAKSRSASPPFGAEAQAARRRQSSGRVFFYHHNERPDGHHYKEH